MSRASVMPLTRLSTAASHANAARGGRGGKTLTKQTPGPVCETRDLVLMAGGEPDEDANGRRAQNSPSDTVRSKGQTWRIANVLEPQKVRGEVSDLCPPTRRWAEEHLHLLQLITPL